MQRILPLNRARGFRFPLMAVAAIGIAIALGSGSPAPVLAIGHTGGYCMNQAGFSADPPNAQYPYELLLLNRDLEPPTPDAPVERLEHGGFIAYVVLNCRPPVIKFELLTKDKSPVYYEMINPGSTPAPISVTFAGDDTDYFAYSHGHSSVNDAEIDPQLFGLELSPYHSHGGPQAYTHRWVLSPESAALQGGTIDHLDPYKIYTVRVTFYTGSVGAEGANLGEWDLKVPPHVDNSIWNRILTNLNPLLWAFRINLAIGHGVQRVICIPLKFVGVHSSNCSGDDADVHAAQSPKFPSAIDTKIAGLRKVTPGDIERERQEMFVQLREQGYPIQVASHPSGTLDNNDVADVAAEGQPFIARSTCWLPGDTVEFLVRFDNPTAIVRPLALSLGNMETQSGPIGTHVPIYQFAYYAGTVSSPGGTWTGTVPAATWGERDYDMRTTHIFKYVVPERNDAEVRTAAPPGGQRGGIHLKPLWQGTETDTSVSYQNTGTFFVLMDETGENITNYQSQGDLINQSQRKASEVNILGNIPDQIAALRNQAGIRAVGLPHTSVETAFIGVSESMEDLVTDADVQAHLTAVNITRTNQIDLGITWANHCVHYEVKTQPGIAPKMTFTGVIEGTPAHLTYGMPFVRRAWRVMLSLVVSVMLILIAYSGMSIIVGHFTGHGPGAVRELVPRFILAIIAAATSLWWCALLVDLSDGVTKFVSAALDVRAGDVVFISKNALNGLADNLGGGAFSSGAGVAHRAPAVLKQAVAVGIMMVFNTLLIVYALLGLMIIAQFIIRLVMINLLTALAPLGAAMWSLPQTTGWGKKWLQFWMTTLFQQALQIVGLALALGYIKGVAPPTSGGTWDDFVWALGMGIAALFLTYKLPTMIGAPGVYESWLQTLTMLTMTAANIGAMGGKGLAGAASAFGQTRAGTGLGVGAINLGQRIGQSSFGQSWMGRGLGAAGRGLGALTKWQSRQ